jgi:CRISPR-associated protein Csb2
MSVTISIRFLTGRAHLHPWQTHHSEGRVEWPPSQWRLLRALVAVAGRGLTSLPYPDEIPATKPKAVVAVPGMAKPTERGIPPATRKKLSFSKPKQTLTLKEPLTDAEADVWKVANPGDAFATALDELRKLTATLDPVAMGDVGSDEIPISRFAELLRVLSETPTIWLPKTGGGHTRQYFKVHNAGMTENTGSAVFDTFATVRKDQPLLFHWRDLNLNDPQLADLRLMLSRMTYFGRAESWCQAEAHTCPPQEITAKGASDIVPETTHWECRCIEDHGKPAGKEEYRDYLLERRLAPVKALEKEVPELLPLTNQLNGKKRNDADRGKLKSLLQTESPDKVLVRCLLRESGQDIKDGLERPIGTRWIHYAVPRAVYDVPRPRPQPRPRRQESVDLVRYALNTATVGRAVLPSVTDTLLVADRFRSAAMALCREPSRTLSGHEVDDSPCKDHEHAFWWPMDEDNDGFIDHAMVFAPGGFDQREIDALRRLTRLRQRGGRPDILVTPTFVGRSSEYPPWTRGGQPTTTFVSATPYFCPIHLSHGRGRSGKPRPILPELFKGLMQLGVIASEGEVESIQEIIFDYAPNDLIATEAAISAGQTHEPVVPRQYFPVVTPPQQFSPLPNAHAFRDLRFLEACCKHPNEGFTFGTSIGLLTNNGSRFIRAMSFCRRRRNHEVRGPGRMFRVEFVHPRQPRPFAIGSQCHFGLGLFSAEGSS